MPVEVHAEALKRRYVAPWLSIACFLNLAILAGAAVLPLYIIYVTRMWQVQVVRFEQMALTYQSSLVVQLQGLKGASTGYRAPFTAMWSTSPAANDLLGNGIVRGMVLRSSFQDVNYDGLGDVFKISVTMPLNADETIHGATVVAYMNAGFSVRLARAPALVATAAAPRRRRPCLTPRPPTILPRPRARRRARPACRWTPSCRTASPRACRGSASSSTATSRCSSAARCRAWAARPTRRTSPRRSRA